MTDLPNFSKVSLDEVIEHGDALLDRGDGGAPLHDWVTAENKRRAEARIEFEARSVEVAGVMLAPGDCAHLTLKDHWSSKSRRKLNCVIIGQAVTRNNYGPTMLVLRFTQHGAKDDGQYHRRRAGSVTLDSIAAVEKVDKPAWITTYEAKATERGW